MLKIGGIRLHIHHDGQALRREAARALGVPVGRVRDIQVLRRAVDARRRDDIRFVYTLAAALDGEDDLLARGGAQPYHAPDYPLPPRLSPPTLRPVVVGAGPAGLFAALRLAQAGLAPLVLERGADTARRVRHVAAFHAGGELLADSNVQFGEGGAGTFSDGKLVTRIRDARCPYVLRVLTDMGAPPEISWSAAAHVGSDRLRAVMVNLRTHIQSLGGQFRFDCHAADILSHNGALSALRTADGERIDTTALVLACGHSARDTYQMLQERGLELRAQSFAVGFRIEHPREYIDKALYGRFAGDAALGAAAYSLSTKVAGRPVHSFCMCPGGEVVNASSEAQGLCLNGMSYLARNARNSNAAIVAVLTPQEMGEDPLCGVALQRQLERHAYTRGGGGYAVPAQRLDDFLAGRGAARAFTDVQPSALPHVVPTDIGGILPGELDAAIRAAFTAFDAQISGFVLPAAVLSAVETRTSAPVRVVRAQDGQATRLQGLYPAGEGAGYAGGIISAAVDGLRAAEAILAKWG